MLNYILVFLSTFILSIILTPVFKKIALRFNIVDKPVNHDKKLHHKPIPYLGGVAVFLCFNLVLLFLTFFTDLITYDFIELKNIIGIVIAGSVIMFGGIIDDKYDLKPKYQIIFPVLAALIIVMSGIGIDHIKNPFGGEIRFDQYEIILFWWQGTAYKITILADLFTFIWLLGMMYTTKILDGLDGLVSGITVIGSVIIFIIALSVIVAQPNTALLALILAGAYAGFLIFNFNPAKIFLGEGGSLFAGLILGVLAIISGSKVATTLLIMGIPILDVGWAIGRRLFTGKSPFSGDAQHLHHRLLNVGFSHKQAVIFLYCLTALFGASALFLQSFGKLIALLILTAVMTGLIILLIIIYKKKSYKYE